MKRLQFTVIKRQILLSLQNNLVEALLGLCFFVMAILAEVLPYPDNRLWDNMPLMFPILFVVAYCANYLFTERRRWLYYLSLLTLMPLLLLSDQLTQFVDSSAYLFSLVLAFFLLLAHRSVKRNKTFARQALKLMNDLAFALLIGLLLMGTIFAIYSSVIYVFDLSSSELFFVSVLSVVFYLFVPLLFSWLQREEQTGWKTLPAMVQFVLNFILSPGIIIYTGVLYLYLLTIALHWELPKGGVAYMVMAFIGIGFLGRMSQLIVSRRLYNWFYRPFGFIAIPPLLLFWIGNIYRVSEYSFTESRVYLLAGGVLMTLFMFFIYSKRLGSYRLMLLISSAAIALLTYMPGISARSIGLRSQTNRMERLARQLSLWNEATDRFLVTINFQPQDSTQIYAARELKASYNYLCNEEGIDKIDARYGSIDLDQVFQKLESHLFSRPIVDIPLEGYTRYLAGCHYYLSPTDTIIVRQEGRLLLQANLKTHFDAYKSAFDNWQKNATLLAPFCITNDSCLVVIDCIRREEDGSYRMDHCNQIMVFEK